MRNLILVAVAAIAAVGAYLWYSGQSPKDAMKEAGDAIGAPAALENASDAVGAVAGQAQEAAGSVTTAATDTAEDTVDAVTGAAEGAADATQDAAAAATDTATDVVTATEGATEQAVEATGEAAEQAADATQTATDAAGAASDAAEAVAETNEIGIADLLTVDGFDYDKVATYIDGSGLNAIAKTGAKALLEQAKNNPDALQGVLDQLRGALNL